MSGRSRIDSSDEEASVGTGSKRRKSFGPGDASAPPMPLQLALPPVLLAPSVVPNAITRAGFYDLTQGSILGYFPRALEQLAKLLPALLALPWEQREVVVMGRRVQQPRQICYFADSPTLTYTYSGLTLSPLPWGSGAVAQIKEAVERLVASESAAAGLPGAGNPSSGASASDCAGSQGTDAGFSDDNGGGGGGGEGASSSGGGAFNSCLLNLYEDGSRYVGWHRDDDKVFGSEPEIVSVSFGATRDFHLREAAAGGGAARRRLCVRLSPGDVLVMRGALQRRWQHALPKRAGVDGPRVSLTFRRIVAPEAAR